MLDRVGPFRRLRFDFSCISSPHLTPTPSLGGSGEGEDILPCFIFAQHPDSCAWMGCSPHSGSAAADLILHL